MDSFEIKAMDTTFYIEISNSVVFEWKDAVSAFLQYLDKEFSRFQTNNELWRFNQLEKNETVVISPVFYDLLYRANEYFEKTDGRFSPFLLNQMEAHGYNRSFPIKTSNNRFVSVDYRIETQPLVFHGNCKVTKRTGQEIDLGGIAKGYAVEALAQWLRKQARSKFGMVDGGGDMELWSNGEKTWSIGVMDPFNDEKEIGYFEIQNGGIATSNIIYRSWWQDGIKKHHILDGRTGKPVESKIVQATVVSQHCLDAEIGAKICFMEEPLLVKEELKKISAKFYFVLIKSDGEIVKGGVR